MAKYCLTWLMEKYNLSTNITLSQLNHTLLDEYFPLFLATIFTLTVGAVANLACIIVYWKSINPSRFRTYVLYISSLDTLSCFLYMPTLVVELLFPLQYPDEATCIISYYVGDFTTLATIIALLLIAIERVRHVFHPLKCETSREQVEIGFFFGIFTALLVAAPRLKMMGLTELRIDGTNLTATACFQEQEYINSDFAHGYVVFTNLVCITLYSLAFLASTVSIIKMQVTPQFRVRQEFLPLKVFYSRNLTIMMFITTVKFSLTHVPLFVYMVNRYWNKNRGCTMPFYRGLIFQLFGFLFVLNYVLNPFIYGYFDDRFRQTVRSLFFTFTGTSLKDDEGEEEGGKSLVCRMESLQSPKETADDISPHTQADDTSLHVQSVKESCRKESIGRFVKMKKKDSVSEEMDHKAGGVSGGMWKKMKSNFRS